MYKKLVALSKDYISPLHIQGLSGRVLTIPARGRNTNNILFVYGIHGSLERFYGVVLYLARFGKVTMPDLPGFGGMETFYKIGKRPSFDAYADYLADFIRQQYGQEPIRIVALSYGFSVVTRMLQRHPELTSQTKMLVSMVGLTDGRQISMRGPKRWGVEFLFWVARTRPLGSILQYINTRPWVLKLTYGENHPKMRAIAPEDRPGFIDFEEYLWRCNDMRTYGVCMHELFVLRQKDPVIPLTVHHIGTAHDHLLNNEEVIKGLKATYQAVEVYQSNLTNHGGTAYDTEEESRAMIPEAVTTILEATK